MPSLENFWKPDDGKFYDAAFARAMASTDPSRSFDLAHNLALYPFSSRITITRPVRLLGLGGGSGNAAAVSYQFSNATIDAPVEAGGILINTMQFGGGYVVEIEGINILLSARYDGSQKTPGLCNGIEAHSTISLRNVGCYFSPGDGLRIWTNIGENADGCVLDNITCDYNCGDGWRTFGGDSSEGVANVKAHSNGAWGVHLSDESGWQVTGGAHSVDAPGGLGPVKTDDGTGSNVFTGFYTDTPPNGTPGSTSYLNGSSVVIGGALAGSDVRGGQVLSYSGGRATFPHGLRQIGPDGQSVQLGGGGLLSLESNTGPPQHGDTIDLDYGVIAPGWWALRVSRSPSYPLIALGDQDNGSDPHTWVPRGLRIGLGSDSRRVWGERATIPSLTPPTPDESYQIGDIWLNNAPSGTGDSAGWILCADGAWHPYGVIG